MYVIVVYDVAEERVGKVNKFLKQYLTWIQNSVFEGTVHKALLEAIRVGLTNIMDLNYDTAYLFISSSPNCLQRETIGVEKGFTSRII